MKGSNVVNSKKLDMADYARKAHFDYFKGMAYPYVGLTVNVDITDWLLKIKEHEYPFFLSFLYMVTNAANAVPEFRQRIAGDEIIEYESCTSSYTVALEDGTYCYCSVDCTKPFEEFLPYAKQAQEEAKQAATLNDGEDKLSLFFISSFLGVTYTSIIQPVPQPADSNPRITWCRYFEQNGRILLPISLLCNHALIDGYHMGLFYKNLEKQMKEF